MNVKIAALRILKGHIAGLEDWVFDLEEDLGRELTDREFTEISSQIHYYSQELLDILDENMEQAK